MPSEPFVDIHCHLLPGIDDGAKTWDESLAMARLAVADGFSTMVVTPHQLGSFAHNDGATIRSLAAEFQTRLQQENIPLVVLPGADVRIEPGMVDGLRRGDVLSLADWRRHVLLELPHEIYVSLDRLLGELAGISMVGILSHPERNHGILAQPAVVKTLVEAGCLIQITAGSLIGAFGPHSQRLSEQLLAGGLVHFVSTDAHGVKARRPLMRAAFERVVELSGRESAVELCCHNPARVAAGQAVAAGIRPHAKTRSIGSWLPWKKAS